MRPDKSATPVADAWLGADQPLLRVNGCWRLGPLADESACDARSRRRRPREHRARAQWPRDESTWYPAATSRFQTPS